MESRGANGEDYVRGNHAAGLSRQLDSQSLAGDRPFKHPALADHEDDLEECIKAPDTVRESLKDPKVHLYYKKSGKTYVCAVIRQTDTQTGFVVTAYFTEKFKQGTELWTK